MAYRDEVRTAREQFEGAVESAAAEALRIAEEYGKPLQVVCKDIAPEAWKALDSKARRLKADPRARGRDARQGTIRSARALAKSDPEMAAALAREIAKVNPDAVFEVAMEQSGRTRSASPSNKAKVEAAFGPSEFNRLEDAEDAVIERLPDLAPNKDDQAYAEELANKTDGVADMLRGWARGENVGKEVEEWLSQR